MARIEALQIATSRAQTWTLNAIVL